MLTLLAGLTPAASAFEPGPAPASAPGAVPAGQTAVGWVVLAQPDLPWGGRAVAVDISAADPAAPNVAFAASESDGRFATQWDASCGAALD